MSQVSTDPIADMLSRIRNAIAVNQSQISMPYSRIKESVAKTLAEGGFILNVNVDNKQQFKQLILDLTNDRENSPITEIVRLSKPGRRYYSKSNDIPTIKRGRGLVIVSTSQGIMSGSRAKQKKIGGELICKVY